MRGHRVVSGRREWIGMGRAGIRTFRISAGGVGTKRENRLRFCRFLCQTEPGGVEVCVQVKRIGVTLLPL